MRMEYCQNEHKWNTVILPEFAFFLCFCIPDGNVIIQLQVRKQIQLNKYNIIQMLFCAMRIIRF